MEQVSVFRLRLGLVLIGIWWIPIWLLAPLVAHLVDIEPSPVSETSDNGRLAFTLGRIPAGKSFILFLQFQVNPTNVAWHRPQNVQLDDGRTVLATVHHSITVFP
jgi:hypothetical protein